MKTKTRKELRFSPDDTDNLYAALATYVENRGGKLMVVGGIEVQEWPNDPKLCFRIALRCTGKKPDFACPQTDDSTTVKTSNQKK